MQRVGGVMEGRKETFSLSDTCTYMYLNLV